MSDCISSLSARGPISEADMWEAVRSLEAAESLTNEERESYTGKRFQAEYRTSEAGACRCCC